LNTTGSANAAVGINALLSNIDGALNTALGYQALESNTSGGANTAVGQAALHTNTIGTHNTAIGSGALSTNIMGSDNIALGDAAGVSITGDDNIAIGSEGNPGESETIRIGHLQTKTFIVGIHGVTTGIGNAIPVLIDSAGQLGTMNSSRRFKKEIEPMDKTSEVILGLKPVTFHYKNDNTSTPQFGLIAEQVAEVNPNLVVRDDHGEIYTVRYDAVNAMLLNEFLKEHRAFAEEQRKVQQQQEEIDVLKADLKEQRALIQKVSDRMESKESTPQVAVNNP
jgi:hypothetical protein